MFNKNKKDLLRRKLIHLYWYKRLILKYFINNTSFDESTRSLAQKYLSNLKKDSSTTRVKNRCTLTGRSRGVYGDFGLSRIKFRELALMGLLPGIRKASW